MNDKKIIRKIYRIAVLAAIILVITFVFYILDQRKTSTYYSQNQGLENQNVNSTNFYSLFKNYPAPDTFRIFSVNNGKAIPNVAVNDKCANEFYSFLVFRQGDDYRSDPSKAVINRSEKCPADKIISFSIQEKIQSNLKSGNYYFIVADQNSTDVWHDPR